jgi:hypothetical protein
MKGPGHYTVAKSLLQHAAEMMVANVAPEDRAELVLRQATVASTATAHAVLAAATALGLSVHLDVVDTNAWRDVAATRPRGPAPDDPVTGHWHGCQDTITLPGSHA